MDAQRTNALTMEGFRDGVGHERCILLDPGQVSKIDRITIVGVLFLLADVVQRETELEPPLLPNREVTEDEESTICSSKLTLAIRSDDFIVENCPTYLCCQRPSDDVERNKVVRALSSLNDFDSVPAIPALHCSDCSGRVAAASRRRRSMG